MPKAVFTTKVDPTYDDLPEEKYHFHALIFAKQKPRLEIGSFTTSPGEPAAIFQAAGVAKRIRDRKS